MIQFQQNPPRAAGLGKFKDDVFFLVFEFDFFQLVHHSQPALNLTRLCGLVPETLNEPQGFPDLFLLIFTGGTPGKKAAGFFLHIKGIIAPVFRDGPERDFDRPSRQVIEKPPVM